MLLLLFFYPRSRVNLGLSITVFRRACKTKIQKVLVLLQDDKEPTSLKALRFASERNTSRYHDYCISKKASPAPSCQTVNRLPCFKMAAPPASALLPGIPPSGSLRRLTRQKEKCRPAYGSGFDIFARIGSPVSNGGTIRGPRCYRLR